MALRGVTGLDAQVGSGGADRGQQRWGRRIFSISMYRSTITWSKNASASFTQGLRQAIPIGSPQDFLTVTATVAPPT